MRFWWQYLRIFTGLGPTRGLFVPGLDAFSLAELELHISDPVEVGVIGDPGFTVSQLWLKPVVGAWHAEVARLRAENAEWLQPWEAGVPTGFPVAVPSVSEFTRLADLRFLRGKALSYLVYLDACPVGFIAVSDFERGARQSVSLGYWAAAEFAGRGIMRAAVSLVVDFLLYELCLHRVEVFVRPENHASVGLVQALGFISEGVRRNFLWVDGAWRDHEVFVLEREVF